MGGETREGERGGERVGLQWDGVDCVYVLLVLVYVRVELVLTFCEEEENEEEEEDARAEVVVEGAKGGGGAVPAGPRHEAAYDGTA